ncbi:hypothetical protein CEUSTIGMA_g11786.t1 [Chlamydomonas eustigma]|uniref:ABC transporter domain-containing protein n=1 Tax=Chlamydomonas eustigma TaxID=1157962 RepID=A0A250XMQ0_9CHLO|nr:hypothetical protein CEUSTIGMA_g11786.t1 [Chlamydomonas eustigma]|eukprot:GAX84364.1 hypothetical protein CEUSTIGMA_g11786.t1 [Chlamydomonas eustigma]
MVVTGADIYGIALNNVTFAYPNCPPFIKEGNLKLPRGSRCLLIGANGTGKTTLLQLVGGKYMVDKTAISVIGRPPFHDTQLTCSGQLSYLGTSWRKDVAFAGYGVPLQVSVDDGYGVPLQGDISAGKMIYGVEGVDPERRTKLIQLLDIDVYQRLNTMSDGQRRRVQICMGLLKPYEVLLLDEITVDLDVVARMRLLEFFKQECTERNATILYATHIFDGLEKWITHIAYMENGQLLKGGQIEGIPEIAEGQGSGQKLMHVVETWLRGELESRHKAIEKRKAEQGPASADATIVPSRTPFSMPSKHLAFFR